jgi:GNAT superfamily N-acetyltransferase
MSEDERREYMHTLVVSGKTPGLLAYAGGRPIAWVSISPRNDYPFLLDNVPGMKFDDPSVWSLMCFYADVNYRGKGIMAKLIAAAADFARASGARVVEAYPVDPSVHPIKEQWQAYYGVVSTFARAGFTKVGEAREGQPVMRLAF